MVLSLLLCYQVLLTQSLPPLMCTARLHCWAVGTHARPTSQTGLESHGESRIEGTGARGVSQGKEQETGQSRMETTGARGTSQGKNRGNENLAGKEQGQVPSQVPSQGKEQEQREFRKERNRNKGNLAREGTGARGISQGKEQEQGAYVLSALLCALRDSLRQDVDQALEVARGAQQERSV